MLVSSGVDPRVRPVSELNNSNILPMRFGIICNGKTLQRWQVNCLDNISKAGYADLVLYIIDKRFDHELMAQNDKAYKRLLYDLYFHHLLRPAVFDKVEIEDAAWPERLYCDAIEQDRSSIAFPDDRISKVKEYRLDFILSFSPWPITGKISKAVKYGVWSFCHSDIERARRAPACFWETLNGDSVTGAVLERFTGEPDMSVILRKGFFNTHAASIAKNINSIYEESARWPSRVCADIANGRAGYIFAKKVKTKALETIVPNNFQVILFMARRFHDRFSQLFYKYVMDEDWNIGIVYRPIHTFLAPETGVEIQWLAPPKNRFRADPFGAVKNGVVYIIFEDYDHGRKKGSISAMRLSEASISRFDSVIDHPLHMSYPFILEFEGMTYCIPEVSRSRQICIYRAQAFPDKWVKASTLIEDFDGVDPTIFRYNGLWWLFCTNRDYGSILNLYVWYSRDLLGPWHPHGLNPVKTDVRSARPAGTPFVYKDALYRPSQDCSKTYGGKIIINRITKLSPAEFEEEPVKTIGPPGDSIYNKGIHTLSAVGDITLVDGKRETINLSILKNALTGYLTRLARERVNAWTKGPRTAEH